MIIHQDYRRLPADHVADVPVSLAVSDVSARGKAVYLYLASLGNGRGFRLSDIAAALGVSVGTIRNAINDLERGGFLDRHNPQRRSDATYTLMVGEGVAA